MRTSHRPALLLLSLAACMQSSPARSTSTKAADITCGDTSPRSNADTALFSIELDSLAATTLRWIDLEIFPGGATAHLRLDSLAVGCTSKDRGVRLTLSGSWNDLPQVQVGTGSHFARTTVRAGSTALLDTVLDMTGPAYQSVRWDRSR
jgi:hypothetical protein